MRLRLPAGLRGPLTVSLRARDTVGNVTAWTHGAASAVTRRTADTTTIHQRARDRETT